ncbi:MAG: hypothetical protein K9K30_13605 [Burkholderiaceae bacterium]|nr:hypothetical protein [Sulfuritalea sp.]MCF8176269.1 hypothetical protein [Burkholderiaceae bacterium]
MSPFDEARYARLLEGQEIREVQIAALENEMTIGSEYYGPTYSIPVDRLKSSPYQCIPLSKACNVITDGDHGSAEYADEGVTFVLSEAVEEGWIDNFKCRFITHKHARKLPRSTLLAEDVLVTKTGVYFGKSTVVDQRFAGANTIAHVGILRIEQRARIDSRYLATFLNSGYGQAQLRRRGIKATRPEIKLLEFADILVPVMSDGLQRRIRQTVLDAHAQREQASQVLEKTAGDLLHAIGLDGRQVPEPRSFVRNSSEAFAAGRLDAEFFTPHVRDMLARLGRDELTIQDVAPVRKERFTPAASGDFHYIEIGGVGADGAAQAESVPQREAPSRATQYVRAGDVVTSTVRPIRRLSAVIDSEQDGYVCSSGFVVLQPRAIKPDVLLTYLRLPPVCALMDLHTSASLYPAISETDLLALPIPEIPAATQQAIEKSALAARQARQRATQLLDAAKRAVEIAIEQDEKSALAYLEAQA